MEELIKNIVTKVGIDEATANSAVGIILNMFAQAAPADKMSQLTNAIPGAQDLMAAAPSSDEAAAPAAAGGLLGGLGGMVAGALGGGDNPMMAALAQLQGQGLSMDQAKQVGTEVAGFAREKAGDDVVNDLAASIPGLSALL